jgi:hypothetical protein
LVVVVILENGFWNFVVGIYENVHEDEEQMKGEDERRKTKLYVGGTPFVMVD